MSTEDVKKPEDDVMDVDVDDEDIFNDEVESGAVNDVSGEPEKDKEQQPEQQQQEQQEEENSLPKINVPELPEFTRKDKTLHEILEMMEDYYPIIPDSVTDYYLAKNGLDCKDVRIKRILALATQKFISDIATDAYEYSRIRSSSTVFNSTNPQARAKALIAGEKQTGSSNNGNSSKKVVLTMDDLSSAVEEYGLNVSRPDFYR